MTVVVKKFALNSCLTYLRLAPSSSSLSHGSRSMKTWEIRPGREGLKSSRELFFGDSLQCDIRGDCPIGMRDLVEGCMQPSTEERFSSMTKVIKAIKELPVYIRNKEEIDFRIDSAIDSLDYGCTLADVVECYFRGSQVAKRNLRGLLSIIRRHASNDYSENFEISDDVIKDVMDCLGIISDKSDK